MPVKIRLSKKGRKKLPFYHIVVADSRAPRDGKFVERIGLYNPQTNPATIELNFDRALDWLQKGAQPTDTCRSILSEKGVMIKKHLLEGVKKGAFALEEADIRFQKWLNEKEARNKSQVDTISKGKATEQKKRLEAEVKVKEAKAEVLAKKLKAQAKEAQAEKEEEVTEAVAEAPVAKSVVTEPPAVEEAVAEASDVEISEDVVSEDAKEEEGASEAAEG
jgi:small subunit ribosomal protein S16